MRRVSHLMLAVCLLSITTMSRAAEVDALLPKETEQVVSVNVKQMLESEIMKKFALGQIKQAMEGNEAKAMLEQLGLDPLKDIDRLTAGIWGEDPQEMNAVVVLRGRFDPKKLFAAAENASQTMGDKISIVEEGDYKLVKVSGDNGKPFFASAADEKTLVGGTDKKLVAASLKAHADKAKPVITRELSAIVLKQDAKATMFFCGVTEGKIGELPGNLNGIPGVDGEQLAKQLQQMVNVGMTMRMGSEIAVEITMGMKTIDAADDLGVTVSKLVDLAKTFLPLVGGNAPQAKGLIDDVTKTLKSSVKDKDVTIVVKMSAESIGEAAGANDN